MFSNLKTLSIGIAIALSVSSISSGQFLGSNGQARLFTGNTTANGGNTISGALIGINTGGVDNVLIHDYDTSSLAGSQVNGAIVTFGIWLLYTSPSPRDKRQSRMPSSA